MKNKYIGLVILYSLLFLPIWGLLFLEANNSNSFSIFVGLLYTPVSSYFIRNIESLKDVKYLNWYIVLGPIIYLIASFSSFPLSGFSVLNPILWAFCILFIGNLLIKAVDIKVVFFTCFISYFYAYHLYPLFKDDIEQNRLALEVIEERNLVLEKNLSEYRFENNKGDTIKLKTTKQYIMVETWNESCPPCIAAMSDLQPLLDSLSNKVDHYYLYENGASKLYTSKSKIYSYSHIQNKSKILMDIQNQFFKDSKMESFPCFLLFDNEGNLVDYFKGYNLNYKEYFVRRIKKMIASS
jgi:thiol-disulfide isomerase/thioredoxin